MNKVILMSIQPKWLVKILNGEKTIEIRKTTPKCELPIDVYLYCTKGTLYFNRTLLNPNLFHREGKVIVKFTLNKVEEVVDNGSLYRINNDVAHTNKVARNSCLDFKEMKKYLEGKNGYAYHIDNLVIFDKPMELREFETSNIPDNAVFESRDGERYFYLPERQTWHFYSSPLTKAPQSWQYAYVRNDK